MSTEGKWTPGPWVASPEYEGGLCNYVHVNGRMIADCNSGEDDDEANARLIAAAPDLYDALQAMVGRWEPETEWGRTTWEQARAALAKARGEAS